MVYFGDHVALNILTVSLSIIVTLSAVNVHTLRGTQTQEQRRKASSLSLGLTQKRRITDRGKAEISHGI